MRMVSSVINSLIALSLFLLTASCQTENNKPLPKQPNVVIILSDDQGWGDLSLTGNPYLSTPNIDKLASNGAFLNRFFVSPVCSPTRGELLTGRHAVRGGIYSTSTGGERLDLDETTFAELFKQEGYATAAYGKWHNGMQYPYHPNARGFDDYYGFCSGHWGNYFNPMLEHNGQIVKGDGFIIDDFTSHAIDFIETNKENPFLLYLPFNTPHSPMQVPDRWWSKFEDMEIEANHPNSEKEDKEHTRAAYAMCENIDWNVGRVMTKLQELGLEENTIVIYMADNGPNGWRWNGGMKGRKGQTDEGGVRSPFIIQWKGMIEAGKKINKIASSLDLLPTLTAFAGIQSKSAKPLDGKSLLPLLMEEDPSWDDRIIVNHWKNRTSIRNQQFRLDHENKLFDMVNDPGQEKDVSLEFPNKLEELKGYKNKWENEVLIELPENDERMFPVGHPDFKYTQLPARDAIAHGNIKRSARSPNCTYFTNWTSTNDSITWDVEVLETGNFEAVVYYACAEENLGSTIQLKYGQNTVHHKTIKANNPEIHGAVNDRIVRTQSYVKDFKPMSLGTINLQKGKGVITLKSVDVIGEEVIDFRLLMLKRVPSTKI